MAVSTKLLKPIAPYFGGKYGTIGADIASYIDNIPHKIYVEPFGGMAGVLFLKRPSLIEVYNDLDYRLYNIFKVLRDPKKAKELKRLLKLTPFSREEFLECVRRIKLKPENDVEFARNAIVALAQSVKPSFKEGGFRIGGKNYDTSVARQFKNRTDIIDAITDRLRDIIIENSPAEKLILRYNSEETLIYMDPPYMPDTRNKSKTNKTKHNDYGIEMDVIEHELLLLTSKHMKSKVIISGYDNPLYNEMLSSWCRTEIESTSHMAGSRLEPGDITMKRTEVLWSNFLLNSQTKLEF